MAAALPNSWSRSRVSITASAALAVIETLEQDKLIDNAAAMGTLMLQAFRDRLGAAPGVVSIRGKGLMIGIELDRPCAELMQQALARKLLINVTADSVVRLLPPLTLTHEQAQTIVATVSELIETFLGDPQ
jgi:acetylornithine aminotransferase